MSFSSNFEKQDTKLIYYRKASRTTAKAFGQTQKNCMRRNDKRPVSIRI